MLERFDRWVMHQGLTSRSRALSYVVREKLAEGEWELGEATAAATINLVYDHHTRETVDTLIDVQHNFLDVIVSTIHIHMDVHLCFEVIILRGVGRRIREAASELRKIRGVLHCTMTPATTGVGYHKPHKHS